MDPLASARTELDRHLIELECLVHTLNAPDDAPEIAFVLECMVDRLRTHWEALQPLINGGMGGMPPMSTQDDAVPIPTRVCSIGEPEA